MTWGSERNYWLELSLFNDIQIMGKDLKVGQQEPLFINTCMKLESERKNWLELWLFNGIQITGKIKM